MRWRSITCSVLITHPSSFTAETDRLRRGPGAQIARHTLLDGIFASHGWDVAPGGWCHIAEVLCRKSALLLQQRAPGSGQPESFHDL